MKNKVVLTESEEKKLNLIMDEIIQNGGLTTEQMIERFNAIPFEQFINNLREKVEIRINDNICNQ